MTNLINVLKEAATMNGHYKWVIELLNLGADFNPSGEALYLIHQFEGSQEELESDSQLDQLKEEFKLDMQIHLDELNYSFVAFILDI